MSLCLQPMPDEDKESCKRLCRDIAPRFDAMSMGSIAYSPLAYRRL